MELKEAQEIFKKGDIVTHVNGGRGEVLDLKNDWSTTPPTVVATVRVLDTVFHDIRNTPIENLEKVDGEIYETTFVLHKTGAVTLSDGTRFGPSTHVARTLASVAK